MDVPINQELVGFRVSVKLSNITVVGLVRNIGSGGSKLSLVNAVEQATNKKMPALYHIFLKDILSISKLERGDGMIPLADSTPTTSTKKLIAPKNNFPSHLKHLNNHIDANVLVNKVPMQPKPEAVAIPLPEYSIIDTIDDSYHDAIGHILSEKVVGISMEGVRVCRSGIVCWIGAATSSRVYLFDICSLGKVGLDAGLNDLYLDSRILKVVHDCRYMSDALVHQYGIEMINVFDTQVAASAVELQQTGQFSRFVKSLPGCLTNDLSMPRDSVFHPRVREGHEREDEEKWTQRPLPQHLVEGAVSNVCHLRSLRLVLMEKLLSVVNRGTNLYLKEVSQLVEDKVPGKLVTSHFLPDSFKKLMPVPQTDRAESQVFSSTVAHSCDPYVSFTRHVPHTNPKPWH